MNQTCNYLTAKKNYTSGETILVLGKKKTISSNPNRIQITRFQFTEPPVSITHACNPNAFIDWHVMALKALHDVNAGELITYHYGTSEWNYSIGAFKCNCGEDKCIGFFKGFKYLSNQEKQRICTFASPYIQKMWKRSKQ